MQPLTRQYWVTALAVCGLVVTNLTINAAVMVLTPKRFESYEIVNQFLIGWLFGQVAFVGLWFGLGDWRWYVRVVIAVALFLAVAKSVDVAVGLTDYPPEGSGWGELGFLMIAIGLTVSLPAFLMRRMRSWRLTWQHAALPPPAAQFQLEDALLWTVIISGVLGAIRFLKSLDASFHEVWLPMLVLSLSLVFGALVGLVTAFSRRNLSTRLTLVFLAGVLIASTATVLSYFELYPFSPARWNSFAESARELAGHAAIVFATIACSLANSLVLRKLGCRLVRPRASTPIAAIKITLS